VVNHGVRRENGVVRLDDRGGDRGSRLNGEIQFALLAIVD
jgi:hypothetical protein